MVPGIKPPLDRGAIHSPDPSIRELLTAFPTMPATMIAERMGWTRGKTVFADRVRELHPTYLPPDPASREKPEARSRCWLPPRSAFAGFRFRPR